MKKKIRLEFFDRSGTKHSVTIEGEFTTENVNRLIEYAEIVAGAGSSLGPQSQQRESKIDRVIDVINTKFADREFDSRLLWRAYVETWSDEFSMGAISTYLSRLADRGVLERLGSSSHWFYRLKPSPKLAE